MNAASYDIEDAIIGALYCEEILDALTTWQRIVIVMKMRGYENREIAKWRGCSYENIQQALYKVRNKLSHMRGT